MFCCIWNVTHRCCFFFSINGAKIICLSLLCKPCATSTTRRIKRWPTLSGKLLVKRCHRDCNCCLEDLFMTYSRMNGTELHAWKRLLPHDCDVPEINFVNSTKINGDIICLTSVMKVRQLLRFPRGMYISLINLATYDQIARTSYVILALRMLRSWFRNSGERLKKKI